MNYCGFTFGSLDWYQIWTARLGTDKRNRKRCDTRRMSPRWAEPAEPQPASSDLQNTVPWQIIYTWRSRRVQCWTFSCSKPFGQQTRKVLGLSNSNNASRIVLQQDFSSGSGSTCTTQTSVDERRQSCQPPRNSTKAATKGSFLSSFT